MISSFCFFRVANRHTFGALFGRDLVAPARREHYRTMLGDMVIAYLTAERAAGLSAELRHDLLTLGKRRRNIPTHRD